MIKKIKGKYHVYSESGKQFGVYDTLAAAKKRIAQMEYFKHNPKLAHELAKRHGKK